jgi:hypothetical protein
VEHRAAESPCLDQFEPRRVGQVGEEGQATPERDGLNHQDVFVDEPARESD